MFTEEFYKTLIDNLYDGVYFMNTERKITFWSKAAENITGYTAEEMIGLPCDKTCLSHIDNCGHPLCTLGCPVNTTIMDGIRHNANVYVRHKDGYRMPVTVSIIPIKDGDKIIGAAEIFTPSAPIKYEDDLIERLSNLAMSDRLTNAANRRKIEMFLDYSFHELRCFKKMFCVLFLDIDNFGLLNNTYGHDVGDKILQSIVNTIDSNMHSTDIFGRWGGEEFVGIFKITTPAEAIKIAEKIRKLIASITIDFENKKISVTASIGITLAHKNDSVSTLIRRADALMYKSKRNNKNCVTTDIKI